MLKNLMISTALIAGLGSAASAATITHTETLTDQLTDYSGRVVGTIDQFDSSLGTLNSVLINLTGTVSGGVQYESTDASAATINLNLSAEVELSSGNNSLLVVLPSLTETRQATAFDGLIDFAGTSGGIVNGLSSSLGNRTTLTGAAMTDFIGNGFVDLNLNATGLSNAGGAGNLGVFFSTFAGGTVEVTYDFTPTTPPPPPPSPVPLPAGMPLMLVGLAALGIAQRRKG